MPACVPLSFYNVFRKATALSCSSCFLSVLLVEQCVMFSPFPSLGPRFPPHPLCQSIYQCGVDHSCGGFSFIFFPLVEQGRERGRRKGGGGETGRGRRGVGGKGTRKRHLDDEVKPLGQSFLSISRGQSVSLVGYKKRRVLPALAKLPESFL